jgi:hypothetical protein
MIIGQRNCFAPAEPPAKHVRLNEPIGDDSIILLPKMALRNCEIQRSALSDRIPLNVASIPYRTSAFWSGPDGIFKVLYVAGGAKVRHCDQMVGKRDLRPRCPHQRHSKWQVTSCDSKVMDVRYWVLLSRAVLQQRASASDLVCTKTNESVQDVAFHSPIISIWRSKLLATSLQSGLCRMALSRLLQCFCFHAAKTHS